MKIAQPLVKVTALVGAIVLAVSSSVAQANPSAEITSVQKQWAQFQYKILDRQQQYKSLQSLAQRTHKLSIKYPKNAEILTWDGIVLSSFAGVKGGLGGLSLAKEARRKLERAKKIDPSVLKGSIYTSLGTLYSKVPGWPIGFGNAALAKQHFERALEQNPNGIDPNYFYAEYLANHDQKVKAMAHLQKALNAPARPNRPVADEGRRMEAKQLLAKLQ